MPQADQLSVQVPKHEQYFHDLMAQVYGALAKYLGSFTWSGVVEDLEVRVGAPVITTKADTKVEGILFWRRRYPVHTFTCTIPVLIDNDELTDVEDLVRISTITATYFLTEKDLATPDVHAHEMIHVRITIEQGHPYSNNAEALRKFLLVIERSFLLYNDEALDFTQGFSFSK